MFACQRFAVNQKSATPETHQVGVCRNEGEEVIADSDDGSENCIESTGGLKNRFSVCALLFRDNADGG